MVTARIGDTPRSVHRSRETHEIREGKTSLWQPPPVFTRSIKKPDEKKPNYHYNGSPAI